MEQINFLFTSSIPCLGVARYHSLWSFLRPYFGNLMNFGSSVSTIVLRDLWISSLSLRLGNQFFSLGNPSSSLIDTREGSVTLLSPSRFDRRLFHFIFQFGCLFCPNWLRSFRGYSFVSLPEKFSEAVLYPFCFSGSNVNIMRA